MALDSLITITVINRIILSIVSVNSTGGNWESNLLKAEIFRRKL